MREINKTGTGQIDREEFVEFYRRSAEYKPKVVDMNLERTGYRTDLTLKSEPHSNFFGAEAGGVLPRKLLLEDGEIYSILFELMENPALSETVWNLLKHMPPSKEVLRRVLAIGQPLSQDNPQFPWHELLHEDNPYQLLYVLQVIEFMMEDQEEQIRKVTSIIFDSERQDVESSDLHF